MPELLKVLYVTHRVPYPPDKGDRIRNYHVLRFLARRHEVHLACLADEPISDEATDVLQSLCERVCIVPLHSRTRTLRMASAIITRRSASLSAFHSNELRDTLQSWVKNTLFDVALASSSSVAPYLQQSRHEVPAIVDLVDVDSEKWLNYASSARPLKSWLYQLEGKALRKYEQEISQWAKAILLVSSHEKELFRSFAPDAPVEAVTNGVDLEYFQPVVQDSIPDRCVFVGALDYHPNVDAVCWFAKEVWPGIRKQVPDATFQIVGRKPVPSVLSLSESAGVEVIGQVPDVRPYVQAAKVVLAPLRIARGLQNKVLEAMAMGKPVVASPQALAGLFVDKTNPAIPANCVREWIIQVKALLSDQERCDELGIQGRHFVENNYDWDSCLEPLQKLISGASSKRQPRSSAFEFTGSS